MLRYCWSYQVGRMTMWVFLTKLFNVVLHPLQSHQLVKHPWKSFHHLFVKPRYKLVLMISSLHCRPHFLYVFCCIHLATLVLKSCLHCRARPRCQSREKQGMQLCTGFPPEIGICQDYAHDDHWLMPIMMALSLKTKCCAMVVFFFFLFCCCILMPTAMIFSSDTIVRRS